MSTNTNDLRAAAERAVQWYTTPNTPDACRNMPDHVFYAGYHACRAYLAEHAADDDAPWDMDWLTRISFGRTGDRGTMVIENARLRVVATDVPYWLIADIVSGGLIRIPRPETRRDVRQLLRSLGFKAKEAT